VSDRSEIADLFARLSGLLDGRRHEDAHTVYADDVAVHGPRGELRGIEEVTAFLAGGWDSEVDTRHVHGDVLVDVDGDRATATASQLVHFYRPGSAPHRTSGLSVACTAVRTPAGWRFGDSRITLLWTDPRAA
jgi:hypothetical protein